MTVRASYGIFWKTGRYFKATALSPRPLPMAITSRLNNAKSLSESMGEPIREAICSPLALSKNSIFPRFLPASYRTDPYNFQSAPT